MFTHNSTESSYANGFENYVKNGGIHPAIAENGSLDPVMHDKIKLNLELVELHDAFFRENTKQGKPKISWFDVKVFENIDMTRRAGIITLIIVAVLILFCLTYFLKTFQRDIADHNQ